METQVAEGFFSDAVVLVEGQEDKAIMSAALRMAGVDLEERNIALLDVGGKENLDRPYAIFRALGLMTYVIFDADGDCATKQRKRTARGNRMLLRLLGEPECDFPATTVSARCAYFASNLAATVRDEIGTEVFHASLNKVAKKLGYSKVDDARKNATVLEGVLKALHKAGHRSATLDAVVDKLNALDRSAQSL